MTDIAVPIICGDCGAENPPGRPICWLCYQRVSPPPPAFDAQSRATALGQVPPLEGQTGRAVELRPTFKLSSLMLLVTLLAVCFGAFRIAPGLAIALLIIVTPAMVRTFVSGARRKQRGEQLSIGDKVLSFAGSLSIMLLIAVAAGISFFATCWIACFGVAAIGSEGGSAIAAGLIVGALVALALSIGLFVLSWPRRR